jgi:hypothetical protein
VRRFVIGVLSLTLIFLFAPAAPAQAQQCCIGDGQGVQHGLCFTSGFSGTHYLETWAHYENYGPNMHLWTTYEYRIYGSGTGGESNVNIFWQEDGQTNELWYSPDDRQQNVTYSLTLNVVTDAVTEEQVRFQGIFDVFGSDPQCWAYGVAI